MSRVENIKLKMFINSLIGKTFIFKRRKVSIQKEINLMYEKEISKIESKISHLERTDEKNAELPILKIKLRLTYEKQKNHLQNQVSEVYEKLRYNKESTDIICTIQGKKLYLHRYLADYEGLPLKIKEVMLTKDGLIVVTKAEFIPDNISFEVLPDPAIRIKKNGVSVLTLTATTPLYKSLDSIKSVLGIQTEERKRVLIRALQNIYSEYIF
jgi:hypothetical protein